MSTNYYAIFDNKEIAERYFPEEYEELIEDDKKSYMVHIGKRSYKWKPLFQEHSKAYSSVEEMLGFLGKFSNKIIDEYGKKYSLEEFSEALVDWNKDLRESREFYSNYIGWITIPIDHTTYSQKTTNSYERQFCSHYHNDKDGYNFFVGEFS